MLVTSALRVQPDSLFIENLFWFPRTRSAWQTGIPYRVRRALAATAAACHGAGSTDPHVTEL